MFSFIFLPFPYSVVKQTKLYAEAPHYIRKGASRVGAAHHFGSTAAVLAKGAWFGTVCIIIDFIDDKYIYSFRARAGNCLGNEGRSMQAKRKAGKLNHLIKVVVFFTFANRNKRCARTQLGKESTSTSCCEGKTGTMVSAVD